MAIEYVKPDPDKGTDAAGAIALYEAIDTSHFQDTQRYVLTELVRVTTGFVRSGPDDEGSTNGKPKKAEKKTDAPTNDNKTPPADPDKTGTKTAGE